MMHATLNTSETVLVPRVHPCSVCCTIFSLIAFMFLVRACRGGTCRARALLPPS
jgi:hypothetical protein